MKTYRLFAIFGIKSEMESASIFWKEYALIEDLTSSKKMKCYYRFKGKCREFDIIDYEILQVSRNVIDIKIDSDLIDYLYSFDLINSIHFPLRLSGFKMKIVLSEKAYYHTILHPNQFPL